MKNNNLHNMKRTTVPALEVGKEYLIDELSRIFPEENFRKELVRDISKLSEKQLWRLLEALSFSYRLNKVFWLVSDDSYVWSKEKVSCNDLILSGMNPQINKVIFSKIVQNNPLKFRDYLIAYFKKYPKKDPEGLGQFRPKSVSIKTPTIYLFERDRKLRLFDGQNRFIAHLLAGNKKINAYVGRKVKAGKMRIGDSTFWLLRKVYEKGNKPTKQAVITVVKELMKTSSDGKNAVKNYWISHVVNDEALKKVGKKLISKRL